MELSSAKKEEYLKLIDKNQNKEGFVRNKVLADQLKLANSSVTEMFLKLSHEDLVTYVPYQGAKLTKKGKKYVEQLQKKQQLLCKFLEEYLNCTEQECEDILDQLEHINHDLFFSKLEKYLKKPY